MCVWRTIESQKEDSDCAIFILAILHAWQRNIFMKNISWRTCDVRWEIWPGPITVWYLTSPCLRMSECDQLDYSSGDKIDRNCFIYNIEIIHKYIPPHQQYSVTASRISINIGDWSDWENFLKFSVYQFPRLSPRCGVDTFYLFIRESCTCVLCTDMRTLSHSHLSCGNKVSPNTSYLQSW